jgi:hypothetical protein
MVSFTVQPLSWSGNRSQYPLTRRADMDMAAERPPANDLRYQNTLLAQTCSTRKESSGDF